MALQYLETTLSKEEIEVAFVESDEDWEAYRTDQDFIALMDKYR